MTDLSSLSDCNEQDGDFESESSSIGGDSGSLGGDSVDNIESERDSEGDASGRVWLRVGPVVGSQ